MVVGRSILAARAMRARRPLNALLRARLVSALATPYGIDHYLGLVDPAWSVRNVRARIVGVRPEADDAASLWFLPNENWRGFRPGQFVPLSVWVGGVRHTRCFSFSSAPEDGAWARLTIKAVPGGRVSAWATRRARVGDVVELGQAMGSFVLPEPPPRRILFISGGSGITPLLSMARHLIARGHAGSVAWLHYARREVILGDELAALSRRHPRFDLGLRMRRGSGSRPPAAPFSRSELESWLPGWRDYETFACGPAPLLEAVEAIWHAYGLSGRLHVERFTGPPVAATPATVDAPRDRETYRLVFARSGRETRARGEHTLLEEAERAGLSPPHGCRMGICQTCRCLVRAGTVRSTVTGRLDGEPEREIQLCIHKPCSDLTLDL